MSLKSNVSPQAILERDDFQALIDSLSSHGYKIIGPTIRGDAIVYDDISGLDDLPIGWIDRQENGRYRLARHKKKMLFAHVVPQHSWKRFLYPVQETIWSAERSGKKLNVHPREEDGVRQAFIGVRSCDLHAIQIQDKILLEGAYTSSTYARRREQSFIVAVNCVRAGGTCFCASMGTGPKAASGFDIALTEVVEDDRHYFVIEAGTDAGVDVIRDLPHREASEKEIESAEKAIRSAASRMGRELDIDGLPDLLSRNFENPHWEEVAERCLTCGNCTMVCPTCFCSTIEDWSSLAGTEIQRIRKQDSCFTLEYSYIHGGSVRTSAMSRYRQWMMHKLSHWVGQFGTFGCVGCGRCITWCPVGIDITETARIIRKSE